MFIDCRILVMRQFFVYVYDQEWDRSDFGHKETIHFMTRKKSVMIWSYNWIAFYDQEEGKSGLGHII